MPDDMPHHPAAPHPPTILDEACWAVCPHLQRRACSTLKECRQCPMWEENPEIGLSKRECRSNAEKAAIAVLNVANRWVAAGHVSSRKNTIRQPSKRKARA